MEALLREEEEGEEALQAALSFVDACIVSPGWPGALEDASSGEDAMLGELDELLRATLSPSATSSASGGESATERPSRQLVLPSPLAPLDANLGGPDVAKLKDNGRMRGGCRSSACKPAANNQQSKKRANVNPNRARNERKNELAYLRNKVQQMEAELGELHLHHRVRSTALMAQNATRTEQSTALALEAPTGSDLVLQGGTSLPPFWREMATRQKLRREKAERENARLKLVLEGQIKLARSMEALLLKRARQQVSECADSLGKNGAQGRSLDFLADKRTFDALLASVDAAYHEVDEVFASNGLLGSETRSRDACMREGANGMYLDISSNKLLPFRMEEVGTAVWNHFKGTEKHRGNLYEKAAKKLDSTDDTVMEDFNMEFMGKTTRADFRVKQVLRRYVELDREVVVWVTSVHSLDEGKSRPFAGLGFAEKGYVVIKQPQAPALVKAGYTVVQMCSLVVPQKAESCSQGPTAVGAFTEFVLNVIAANATVSQERIENVLLDQALKTPSMPS